MVAKLARAGKVSSVITQNVDGPHHASSIADGHIIQLHGNGTYAKCLTCEARYELAPITEGFDTVDLKEAKALLEELS